MTLLSRPKGDAAPEFFYNPGKFGDYIYALPFCLQCIGARNIQDAIEAGPRITLVLELTLMSRNPQMISSLRMIAEMLRRQPYIKEILDEPKIDWNSEPFKTTGFLDLGNIRKGTVTMQAGDIVRRYDYLWRTQTHYDCNSPWLVAPSKPDRDWSFVKGKVLVSRSDRYHNDKVNYSSLREISDRLVFLGTVDEHRKFCKLLGCQIEHFKGDFIDYLNIISNAAFFIGNQSLLFSLAEALKVPRLLEYCKSLPDVIPHGGIANDFVNEDDLRRCIRIYSDLM